MLRLLPLFLLLAAAAPARAQAGADTTRAQADTTLASYLGTWEVAVGGTPIGIVSGTLTVDGGGTGALSLTEMEVENAPVTAVQVDGGALVGQSTFYSPVSGIIHTVAIRLAPQPDGTLAGALIEGVSFPTTARRPAP